MTTGNLHFIASPAEMRSHLEWLNQHNLRVNAALDRATPQLAAAVQRYVDYNPAASPGAALAAGQYMTDAGVDVDDPVIQTLAAAESERELEDRSLWEGIKAAGRGFVRGTFTAWQGLFEEIADRPVRTAMGAAVQGGGRPWEAFSTPLLVARLAQGGIGFKDLQDIHRRTGRSDLNLAIRDFVGGEEVDLGEGYFAGGTVRARGLAEREGLSARTQQAIQDSGADEAAQAQLTQQARTNRILTYKGVPLSLGRGTVADVFEPGSKPFNIASGVLDGAFQVFADPVSWATLGTSKVAQARKVFDTRPAFQIITGGRPRTDPRAFAEWLATADEGRAFVDFAAKTNNPELLHQVTRGRLDRATLRLLTAAGDPDQVTQVLTRAVGPEQLTLQRPRNLKVETARWRVKNNPSLGRILSVTPSRHISIFNLDDHVDDVINYMRNAKLNEAERAHLLEQYLYLGDGNVDDIQEWAHLLGERIDNVITEQFGAKPLSITKQFIKNAEKMRSDLAHMFQKAATNPGHHSSGFRVRVGGELMELTTLSIEQFMQTQMALPAMRDIRRATSVLHPLLQNELYKGVIQAGDLFMNTLWKPFQLLRFAWAVRVIAEEQVRLAANGVGDNFTHPIRWVVAMFSQRPEDMVDLLDDPMRMALQWKAAMSRGTAGFLKQPGRRIMDRDIVAHTKPQKAFKPSGREARDLTPTSQYYYDVLADDFLTGTDNPIVKALVDPEFRSARHVGPVELGEQFDTLFDDIGEFVASTVDQAAADDLSLRVREARQLINEGRQAEAVDALESIRDDVMEFWGPARYGQSEPRATRPRIIHDASELADLGMDDAREWTRNLRTALDRGLRDLPADERERLGPLMGELEEQLNRLWQMVGLRDRPADELQDVLNRVNGLIAEAFGVEPTPGMISMFHTRMAQFLREDFADLRLPVRGLRGNEMFALDELDDDDIVLAIEEARAMLDDLATSTDGVLDPMLLEEQGLQQVADAVRAWDEFAADAVFEVPWFLDELGGARDDFPPFIQQLVRGDYDNETLLRAVDSIDYDVNVLLRSVRTDEVLTGPDAVKSWFKYGDGRRYREQLYDAEQQALRNMTDAQLREFFDIGDDVDPSLLLQSNPNSIMKDDVADAYIDGVLDHVKAITGDHDDLKNLLLTGQLDGEDIFKARRKIKKLLHNKYHDVLPDEVYGPDVRELVDEAPLTGLAERWDSVIEHLFDVIMSRSTNRLSRSPAFHAFYWDEVARISNFLTPEARARAVQQATKSRARKEVIQTISEAKATSFEYLLDDWNHIDELAKKVAGDNVRKLLYDLNRRGQFADVTRLMFPFAEAWQEVLGTWIRTIADQHGRPIRRFQQIVQGGRGADPDQDGEGFFYNDENGVERFVYPGLGWALGQTLPDGVSIRASGRTEGLNLIAQSGFLPGFGPAVQWPAGAFISDNPRWDWLRDRLFPFGKPEVLTAGSALDESFPAWAKRVFTAISASINDGKPAINERVFQNTVGDIARANLIGGKYTPDQVDDNLRESAREATLLTAVRGVLQMGFPTGPDLHFTVEDPDGKWWTFQVLADQYRTMLAENNGDHALTTEQFMERFGTDPGVLTAPKTRSLRERALSESGWRWERERLHLADRYPLTFGLWAPDDDSDFDFDAYVASIERGDRVALSAEQQLRLYNNTAGWAEYTAFRDQLALLDVSGDNRQRILAVKRAQLKEQYPGFNSSLDFVPEQAQVDEKIEELRRGLEDPELVAASPHAETLREYLTTRDAVEAYLTSQLGVTLAAEKQALMYRQILLAYGKQLAEQDPHFLHMWTNVLQRELN